MSALGVSSILSKLNRLAGLPRSPLVIAILVIAVGAISTVSLFLQRAELARVTDCQTEANQAFREALTVRSSTASGQSDAQLHQIEQQIQQNEAQEALLSVTIQEDPAASQAAITEYRSVLARNTAALVDLKGKIETSQAVRAGNPLPNLSCGSSGQTLKSS